MGEYRPSPPIFFATFSPQSGFNLVASCFFIFSNWLLQTTGCPARPLLHHCHKVSHSEPPSPGLVVMRMMALMLTMLMAMVMMMVSVVVVVVLMISSINVMR